MGQERPLLNHGREEKGVGRGEERKEEEEERK